MKTISRFVGPIAVLAGVFGLVIAIALFSYWLIWLLWCWSVPQLWTTGPENIIRPSFWLFSGAWLLATMLGRTLLGRGQSNEQGNGK